MATLVAGYTFGATETVTNAKLASLVNNGSISGVTQSDLAASQGLVFTGTSAPSDTDQVWVDTNSTPYILRFYNSNLSAWVPCSELALYTNKTGQTGSAGRVLILDTTNSNGYKYTSTEGDTKFLGIETGSIANNASAPIVSHGKAVVLLETSASAGCYIRSSTATGKAVQTTNAGAGVFAFLTEAGTASANAHIFGIDPNGTLDQTANYTWTGTHTFNGNVTLNTASANTTNWTPIVQVVKTQTAASASLGSTAGAAYDDSIPQNTEGNAISALDTTITPKHSNNILVIDAVCHLSTAGNGQPVCLALYQDNTANAVYAMVDVGTVSATYAHPHYLRFYMTAGTTSATTFKLRAGDISGANAMYLNATSGAAARRLGGVLFSSMTITEIKV